MKFIKSMAIFIVSVVILSSCSSPFLSFSKMSECRKGDDLSFYITEDGLGEFDVDPEEAYQLEGMSDGSKIDVIIYETFFEETNVALIFPMPFTWETKTYSVLAFENKKLLFWGLPEDYLKSNDKKIREIGEKTSDIIYQEFIN